MTDQLHAPRAKGGNLYILEEKEMDLKPCNNVKTRQSGTATEECAIAARQKLMATTVAVFI